ncbi:MULTISPECIES: hypothetical protein [Pseudoalteromonas]|uniref:Uncharacterized protein n=2 Tax=Pseudoalteromonas TaxID=53246 RepID=A0A0F4QY64_9GAMM|nr:MULTISPECIES: hypothetical protein [Pseudoalteromonas]KJZ12643.1 hypothetical protein TW77_02350 [Pseudoalteromonas rubra]QTL38194.1 hypothetical protein J5X90_20870 [Pseudoalteromonas viridis]RZM80172.1 hypothetical protein C3B51_12830 [Pseudoalteromonas rubra]
MKLSLNKKKFKNLSNSKAVGLEQTPQVAGGVDVAFPPTKVNKGCPWFTYIQVYTCNNPV